MELKKTLQKIKEKQCEIEVFGLGYVGFPLAVHLSSSGFKVIGIDTNSERINRLENNSLMDSESKLKDVFLESRKKGNFKLKKTSSKSVKSKIAICCVPTPIPTKEIRSDIYVKNVIESFLKNCNKGDVIIIESSIEVGTTEKMQEIIEANGFQVGKDIGLCFCPERIDPQNKKWNLKNIPRVIYCSDNITYQIAEKIYENVNNAKLTRVNSPRIAEVVKSFENTFRLVNISLVNELAILCDKLEINVKDVIDAASTKPFGFTPFYPGAGAGGHCIPKDPRFLLESAKKFGVGFDTIETSLAVNSIMPNYITDSIEKILEKLKLPKIILVCGLAYKPDIDDMRDSPGFKIIRELLKKKFEVSAYDPYYKVESREKYFIENSFEGLIFEELKDISDDDLIKKYSCICIVQNHNLIKSRLNEIYEKSLVSFIYDCTNKLSKNSKSKTILNVFGR